MRTYLECLPCFLRQSLEATRMVTDDESVHEEVLRKVLVELVDMPFDQSPPHMALKIHRLVREIGDDVDPYKRLKDKYNKFAMEIYPELQEKVRQSEDPFGTAARLAIAGNIIDFGVISELGHEKVLDTIEKALESPLAINYTEDLRKEVAGARRILYLGDNTGEIVFDKLLLEELPRDKVTFAVRGKPILNDATMEDADLVGITSYVKTIDNGSDAPGTILELCSPEFQETFHKADLIIAKGQGNYETLSEADANIYFLLMAKCPVIARDIGCQVGDMLVLKS